MDNKIRFIPTVLYIKGKSLGMLLRILMSAEKMQQQVVGRCVRHKYYIYKTTLAARIAGVHGNLCCFLEKVYLSFFACVVHKFEGDAAAIRA